MLETKFPSHEGGLIMNYNLFLRRAFLATIATDRPSMHDPSGIWRATDISVAPWEPLWLHYNGISWYLCVRLWVGIYFEITNARTFKYWFQVQRRKRGVGFEFREKHVSCWTWNQKKHVVPPWTWYLRSSLFPLKQRIRGSRLIPLEPEVRWSSWFPL